MKKRLFSILLTVCMVLSMLPMSAFATEVENTIGASNVQDSGTPAVCENHKEHTTGEGGCGYIEAVEAVPCNHIHDESCGYVPASEGNACGHVCAVCGTDLLQQQSIMPFAAGTIKGEEVAEGQYYLSHYSGAGTNKPEVGGTANAPVFTFKRTTGVSGLVSGGVFTSNYTMDFTRSFHIEGSVSAAERDGVTFALHTTPKKAAFSQSYNTLMMGPDLLKKWNQNEANWQVTANQNNITKGLLWDFMTYEGSDVPGTRFHKGAYSYQIESSTSVKAYPDDDTSAPLGTKTYSGDTLAGAFKLSWTCTNPANATGTLILQMGSEITFTYTNLNASDVFGDLDKAKAVYFSFSTYLPANDNEEKINETTISIAKAYYTDTIDEDGNSTLNVETSYYIDKDGDSTTYETKLDGKTPLVAGQKVLCRNKISNPNINATTALGMTLLINNLSQNVNGEETQIASIEDEKYYLHEHDAAEETEASGKISSEGNGPLNSTAPLTDYAKVTLPAGGSGTAAYDNAYAVYEYTCVPGAGVTALKQTIQLGVAPFTPKVSDSTVLLPLPTAAQYAEASPAAAVGTDYVVDTSAKTLIINTVKGAAHFSANGSNYLNYKVTLNGTIDVSAFCWTPVGSNDSPFTGTFDGGNHELRNLTVIKLNKDQFGYVAGVFGATTGTVKDLTVSGSVNVSGTDVCTVGGIAGSNHGTIDHCTNKATITLHTTNNRQQSITGGIAGTNTENGIIRNSNHTGTITATSTGYTYAGGIIGASRGGSVQNCFNTGAVSASGGSSENHSGGIAGLGCEKKATIANCYSTGAVSASGTDARVGGIYASDESSGKNNTGVQLTIKNCYYLDAGTTIIINSTQSSIITGCGTIGADKSTLMAGTAENCGSAQDLAHGTALLTALNGWVNTAASTENYTWKADSATPANGGYPVFDKAWADPTAGAKTELAKITDITTAELAYGTTDNKTNAEAKILALAQAKVDEGYTVTIAAGSTYTSPTWSGKFVVTSNTVAADTASDTSNRSITVSVLPARTHTVTYTITNITASGQPTSVTNNSALNATLTAASGYTLPDSIAVSMGGTTLTAGTGYTYTKAAGTVAIASVTGEVVITASGVPTAPVSVKGVTLDKASLSLYTNTSPSSGTLIATVLPANAANKAVTWGSSDTTVATVANGVVTAVGNGTATITVTTTDGGKTATCTVTVSTYNGGGGDGGTTTPPVTKPTEPVTGSTESKATVDNKGNASVSLTDKNITDAIANAKAEATKKGAIAGEITAVINVTTGGKDANTVTINVPKTTQEQVIGDKIAKVELVIDRPDITIGMNLAAVTEINRQANADVQLSATKTDALMLSADAKNAIGSRPAYDLKATYQSGGKSVSDFGSGTVSVEIPYKLQNGEKAGNIYAVYVDAEGKVTYLQNSSYDAKRQSVVFSTNHFSVYGVGYKADATSFTDIANHWAKADIEFVAARGLLSGTSTTTFSPNNSMTRGMFVTALGRLAGIDTSSYKNGKFTDVKADAYYAPYVNWAASKGITGGTTATTFAPDQAVTRQEMAVFMTNYAKAMGYTIPKTREAVTFADNSAIGSWSAEAVKAMQMAGVIQGRDGNRFDPKGKATRAEVSVVLHRFVELVIERTTA